VCQRDVGGLEFDAEFGPGARAAHQRMFGHVSGTTKFFEPLANVIIMPPRACPAAPGRKVGVPLCRVLAELLPLIPNQQSRHNRGMFGMELVTCATMPCSRSTSS
jgi:hypothetical protein